MDKYVRVEGPEAKRAKVTMFKEIVGKSVSERVALDCLNASQGNLERAINMYYNNVGSRDNPIQLEDEGETDDQDVDTVNESRLMECLFLGSISCTGSLTTKLAAGVNELYMDQMLNCSFSIKSPPGSINAYPDTPPELVDILHGSGFVRFSLPSNRSEIGRLPAPFASAIVPLVKLGLAEVTLSVGFPGCAGQNMNPGASVPIRVDVAVTPVAMKTATPQGFASSAEDVKMERVSACWANLLSAMNFNVNSGAALELVAEVTPPEPAALPDAGENGEEESAMTEEMNKLVAEYAKQDLPQIRPPATLFPTNLKDYQAQALFWMASREYPRELGGIPSWICQEKRIQDGNDDTYILPPSWTEITTSSGTTLYFKDGLFQQEKPPPQVECRGGILADEMGLGKTVMTLSLISLDLLTPQRITPMTSMINGGTLIILHLSLLRQWVGELKRHCPALTFSEFHGADRSFDPKSLASVDVVFSTYGTVSVNSENGQSPLLKVAWRRIVLDEAHSIRTRSTKMGKAVARLTAERRWCLTGTPLQNSIVDIFPLVAWLRVSPWKSFAFFKREIMDKPEEGMLNAQKMLKPLMIRRTKAMKGSDGQPLVALPPRRNKTVQIELCPEEKDFYRALFWKTKLEFDKFEKSNAVMFNITHVLQLIVRLRQALCHPILCRSALAVPEALIEPPQTNGVESLDALLQKFIASSKSSTNEYYANAIEDLRKIGIENLECPICLQEPCQFPVMTPCGHTMCRKCVMSRLRGECPICRTVFSNGDIQNITHLSAAAETSKEGAIVCPPLSSKLRVLLDYLARDLKKGRRVIVFSQFVSFIEIISKVFQAKRVPHRTLHGGHNTNQRDAAVEWLASADLSGSDITYIDDLPEHVINVSDNEDERNDTPQSERSQGRVLLVSLKAGGVGLNLVAANVVYLTDLWWNGAIEEQAFNRVHRIAQTKKTITYKFVCHETIDERILDLQATKRDMTADVLGDKDVNVAPGSVGDRSRKLTLEDIRQLFKPQQGSFLT